LKQNQTLTNKHSQNKQTLTKQTNTHKTKQNTHKTKQNTHKTKQNTHKTKQNTLISRNKNPDIIEMMDHLNKKERLAVRTLLKLKNINVMTPKRKLRYTRTKRACELHRHRHQRCIHPIFSSDSCAH